jgi:MATE family multidrug resistance protein
VLAQRLQRSGAWFTMGAPSTTHSEGH